MSRILARQCVNFRRACLPEVGAAAQTMRFLSNTSAAFVGAKEVPIPQSLARYRKSQEPSPKLEQARKTAKSANAPDEDIVAMLAKPTWSVRSLSPPATPPQSITRKQLHHLLRLSALPLPKDQAEEDKMLNSLHSQLHFVGDIQSVNTDGIEPLVRIAEETEASVKENTVGLEDVRHILDKEVVIGRNQRRRRIRVENEKDEGADWDVFKTASETVEVPGSGRYFLVRSGKEPKSVAGEAALKDGTHSA